MGKNLVTLRLGDGGPERRDSSDADFFRHALDEAFRVLADVLRPTDAVAASEAVSSIDRCRTALQAGDPADAIDPLARSSFEATSNVAAHARVRAREQRDQVASLLEVVRETVVAIGGDHATLRQSLAGSADRFEQLTRLDDLQQIQAQLAAEVTSLRRITMEREAVWVERLQVFNTRLSTLETQLDDTRREAALDPLTNVANRRTFERTCREWLAPGRPGFILAMVDVDDFKAINDREGHAVGDRVLITVAETLGQSLRADDLVARLGGDEFAVLARGLTMSQAERRFSAVGRSVQDACRGLVQDGPSPSISIGVAECSAGDSIAGLQRRADEALYHAKRNGKGRIATREVPFIRDLLKMR